MVLLTSTLLLFALESVSGKEHVLTFGQDAETGVSLIEIHRFSKPINGNLVKLQLFNGPWVFILSNVLLKLISADASQLARFKRRTPNQEGNAKMFPGADKNIKGLN